MPASTKTAKRPAAKATSRARAKDTDRRLERVIKSLEAAQKDLTAIGGQLGSGVGDLRRDVKRLLTDAQRDATKLRRAVQRDLARLQKELTASSKPRAAAGRGSKKAAARTSKRTPSGTKKRATGKTARRRSASGSR